MTRGLLLALIGGIASAILTLGMLGPAPILVIGLYLGSAYAGISAGVAALLVLLNSGNNGSGNTIYYVVATGVPALVIIHQALISRPGADPNSVTWCPPGQVLASLSVYGILLLACVAAFVATTGHTLESAARNLIQNITTMVTSTPDFKQLSSVDRASATRMFELSARLAPPTFVGITFTFISLNLIGIATATQGMLNQLGVALRPSPSYRTLELPRWLTGTLAIAIALALLPGAFGSFGLNAALFLSTPFFLLGLTVIHTLSRRSSMPTLVLAAFYIGLFLFGALFGLALPLLALLVFLGIGEQWFSLRQRFAAPGANQEDE